MRKFPIHLQRDTMDCGPTCLRMIAEYHGKIYSIKKLREKSHITRDGVSMLDIKDTSETLGFQSTGAQLTWNQLRENANLPCIVHWKQNHFVVVYKIKPKWSLISFFKKKEKSNCDVFVADPAIGSIKYTETEFKKKWISTHREKKMGSCLLMVPTSAFFLLEEDHEDKKKFQFIYLYLKQNRKLILHLVFSFVVASLIELILPFLTQSIIDKGVNYNDISFLQLVLIAQMTLIIGQALSGFIRGWFTLHLSTRVSISLISDFLGRLMRLPLSFFDSKKTGDIIQRISDNKRIESFLISMALPMFFSVSNFMIFGFILCIYNIEISIIFLLGSILYVIWVKLFFKRRKELEYYRFAEMSDNQSNIMQLINGMQEIKLNNAEEQKKLEWKKIQARLFGISIRSLKIDQYQQAGAVLINNAKNFIITYLAARSVIENQITLGMMLAIQYIIGQLNVPINQFVGFLRSWQDAKISLERLNEIEDGDTEDFDILSKNENLPSSKDIYLKNISYQFNGPRSPFVLENVTVKIPANKVTAIVGTSGSGKTTLLKLLLGYYKPIHGQITIGETQLQSINCHLWRRNTGIVMQDGFIFSDTIAKNIAISDSTVNQEKLLRAVEMANIKEFIESLPLTYNTIIGSEGIGISQGQRQRILIARSIYKNPDFLFLDEATNALDANNERVIVDNLQKFFNGRTVVIVAHRLSTVKNADNILVFEKGKLIEQGSHTQLTKIKGEYFNLVKNQLEMGN